MTQEGKQKATLMIVLGRESCRLIWLKMLASVGLYKITEADRARRIEILNKLKEVRA